MKGDGLQDGKRLIGEGLQDETVWIGEGLQDEMRCPWITSISC